MMYVYVPRVTSTPYSTSLPFAPGSPLSFFFLFLQMIYIRFVYLRASVRVRRSNVRRQPRQPIQCHGHSLPRRRPKSVPFLQTFRTQCRYGYDFPTSATISHTQNVSRLRKNSRYTQNHHLSVHRILSTS